MQKLCAYKFRFRVNTDVPKLLVVVNKQGQKVPQIKTEKFRAEAAVPMDYRGAKIALVGGDPWRCLVKR